MVEQPTGKHLMTSTTSTTNKTKQNKTKQDKQPASQTLLHVDNSHPPPRCTERRTRKIANSDNLIEFTSSTKSPGNFIINSIPQMTSPHQYHDERLLYYGDTTIVGKLRKLLLEANMENRLEMHKSPSALWVVNQYRQPISNTQMWASRSEDEYDFVAYVTLIQKILHQKGAKEGAYSEELYHFVTMDFNGTSERYKNIVLTIGAHSSCLVIPRSKGFGFGPIQTFHRELVDISDWTTTDFEDIAALPDTNWYNPRVAVNITGPVIAIIIVCMKSEINYFSRCKDFIVIATEGLPDEGTRAFLTRLVKKLPHLPCYACFDFNIFGVQIFENLKYGWREAPWQLAPLPNLTNILYPAFVDMIKRKLQGTEAFRVLPSSHREFIYELKRREWISIEPGISRSLDLMCEFGTVSNNLFMNMVPDFFRRMIAQRDVDMSD